MRHDLRLGAHLLPFFTLSSPFFALLHPSSPWAAQICDTISASVHTTFSNDTKRDTLERTGPGVFTDAVLAYASSNPAHEVGGMRAGGAAAHRQGHGQGCGRGQGHGRPYEARSSDARSPLLLCDGRWFGGFQCQLLMCGCVFTDAVLAYASSNPAHEVRLPGDAFAPPSLHTCPG